jgi:hypothetical protein
MANRGGLTIRDHIPIVIDNFNGLWVRGGEDSVPIDHFSDCENISYSQTGFRTRDGLDTYRAVGNVIRLYNYTMNEGQSLIILVEGGAIYHSINEMTLYGPILTIPAMDDFNFQSVSGRAYITPITRTITSQGQTREVGMENEFIYVYKGDGTSARKAAGDPPTNSDDTPLVAYNSTIDGVIDQGIHIIGVTFGDGMGGESTSIGTSVKPLIYALGAKQAYVQNLPIGTIGTVSRKIWMSRAIDPEQFLQADIDSNTGIYTMYLAKEINDNTTLSTIIDISDLNLTTPFVAGSLPNPTSGGITAENTDVEGFCDIGLHVVGVVYETDTGYLTAPGPETLAVQTFVNGNRKVKIDNIPVSPDSFVVKRHLVACRAIADYNGDDLGYQLFFIPDGTIEDNTTTFLEVSFYDADLLDDASYLLDNFAEIPACAMMSQYHHRLVIGTTFDDISIAYFSAPGEPEAIDQVDGVVTIPLDGNPITAGQEFRDVFYVFKQTRTYALNDNGDFPSSWVPIVIDEGIGASIHGISTVLDSGGVNIDFLLIVDYSGVLIFNGFYQRPELSWKIRDYWLSLDRAFFGLIQIMNDSLNQYIYITLPNKRILFGDYSTAMTPKDIKWAKWRFAVETTSIALINTDTLIIGSQQEASA